MANAEPGHEHHVLVEHRGKRPSVDPSAYVAPGAVLSGDVRVGPDARVLYGAVLTAEDGRIEIGACCVVMENAVIRGRAAHPVQLADDVLVGPHAHLNGTTIGEGCFLATGCSLFPGSRLGREVEVRVNGVVHVNTVLEDGALVPIGWVAVGNQVFPPAEHEQIWAIQERLDFPGTVYGVPRDTPPRERMQRQATWYGAHRDDRMEPV